jgi:hypothetical protein
VTEYCGLIHECAHGQMHLVPEFGFLETLDPDLEGRTKVGCCDVCRCKPTARRCKLLFSAR